LSINYGQREAMMAYRGTFFGSPDGKKVLGHLLESLGTFQDPEDLLRLSADRPEVLRGMVQGLLVLKDLGVWIPENFPRLIDAMAGLPMPELKEKPEDGETK
jgi:hypothetical protein